MEAPDEVGTTLRKFLELCSRPATESAAEGEAAEATAAADQP
jgi:hypothetical protein